MSWRRALQPHTRPRQGPRPTSGPQTLLWRGDEEGDEDEEGERLPEGVWRGVVMPPPARRTEARGRSIFDIPRGEHRDLCSPMLGAPPAWRVQRQALTQSQYKIKMPSVHPGHMWPRAHFSIKINQSLKRMNLAILPAEGAIAPLLSHQSGGPLAERLENWRACAVNLWVLATISQGYRLQFTTKPPPSNGVVQSVATGESAVVLKDEISSLLRKRAIRMVPEAESHHRFYSRYFLIPKRGGGLRPILDLRILNKRLRRYKFRMLTNKLLLHSVHHNDWFTIDQDAYFHICITPAHKQFLRFAFQGVAYEYLSVPFGLSLAPQLFTKVVEAALQPLRRKGIRVLACIDDYLLCALSREQANRDTHTLRTHLTTLGFRSNLAKGSMVPAQSIDY